MYMRLDSLPVALRDVSNYQTTPTRTENRTPGCKETSRRSRSQPRRAEKSPCTDGSPHRSHTSRKRSSQQHGVKRSYSATRYPPTPTYEFFLQNLCLILRLCVLDEKLFFVLSLSIHHTLYVIQILLTLIFLSFLLIIFLSNIFLEKYDMSNKLHFQL